MNGALHAVAGEATALYQPSQADMKETPDTHGEGQREREGDVERDRGSERDSSSER